MSTGTYACISSAIGGNPKSLTQCSYDSTNQVSLVVSDCLAIDFDETARSYNAQIGGSHETPVSIDAIACNLDGSCSFIEFKDQGLDSDLPYLVRRKAYETLLLLNDLCGVHISDTRQDADLILVYSSDKTDYDKLPKRNPKKHVSDSPSFVSIGKSLAAAGNDHFIQKGLGSMKGLFFRDVYTYSEGEFASEILPKLRL